MKEKFDRSKPHINIGANTQEQKKKEEPKVLDLSEEIAEIKAVEAEEAMKSIYGEDKIKPLSEEQSKIMGEWGYKKRWRFTELMDLGKDTLEAFDIVEKHQGKIID